MKKLKGTKRLIRLALRRDRAVLPITMLLALLIAGGSAPALASTYPTYEDQLSYVASSAPSIVGRIFQGTVSGVNLGTILTAEVFLFTAVILAIVSTFIITRHTRYNEETGAGELIGSTQVGRSAPLTAALIVAVSFNIIFTILLYGYLATQPDYDKTGSAYFAAALGMSGIFFASVAAIAAQLSDYRRGANTIAIVVLAVSFMIRGVGDALGDISADGLTVTASWISWLSPLGWAYQVLPYNDNRFFPLVMLFVASVICVWVGYFLMSKRDIGSSIFQSKPGSARAKQSLLGTVGLTRKLQRGPFIAWLVGFASFGILIGVMTNDFIETFQENEVFQQLLEGNDESGSFTDSVFASMLPLMIAFMSGYVVSAISKMQSEEVSGRIEFLLATALGRLKWLGSHVGYISLGIIMNILIMGLLAASSYHIAAENPDSTFWGVLSGSVVMIPSMLVFFSVILLVFTLRGAFVKSFAWAYYAYIAFVSMLAGIFEWPDWVSAANPFKYAPTAPAASIDTTPLIVLSLIFVAITALSFILFKTRDLNLK